MSSCWECGHGSVLDGLREHLSPAANWVTWHVWGRWHTKPDLPGELATIWSGETSATIEVARAIYSAFEEVEQERLNAIGTTISIRRPEAG